MGQDHGVGWVVLKQFKAGQGRFTYLTRAQPGVNQQAAFTQEIQIRTGPHLISSTQSKKRKIRHMTSVLEGKGQLLRL